jgi:CMP/dCMP kinase
MASGSRKISARDSAKNIPGKMRKKLIIAIDGPAGAGKSTIASQLSRKLEYVNIETGAMYRALALAAIQADVSFDDQDALLLLAQSSHIALEAAREGNRVLLAAQDVTQRIRERDVTEAASRVSIHPQVREWMVARQRQMGAAGGVVMEGRDIGTKVFPDAEVKIFLDAAPEVRGDRRFRQQPAPSPEKAQALVDEMRERDLRDRTRPNSPLVPAPDAVVIDSTHLTVEEVLQRVDEIIAGKRESTPA